MAVHSLKTSSGNRRARRDTCFLWNIPKALTSLAGMKILEVSEETRNFAGLLSIAGFLAAFALSKLGG
jgi:hypothetical protein